MADIVNLTRVRKGRKAAAKTARAEENRAKYGRTKEEKARDRQARKTLEKHLDGHRRDE